MLGALPAQHVELAVGPEIAAGGPVVADHAGRRPLFALRGRRLPGGRERTVHALRPEAPPTALLDGGRPLAGYLKAGPVAGAPDHRRVVLRQLAVQVVRRTGDRQVLHVTAFGDRQEADGARRRVVHVGL